MHETSPIVAAYKTLIGAVVTTTMPAVGVAAADQPDLETRLRVACLAVGLIGGFLGCIATTLGIIATIRAIQRRQPPPDILETPDPFETTETSEPGEVE